MLENCKKKKKKDVESYGKKSMTFGEREREGLLMNIFRDSDKTQVGLFSWQWKPNGE